MENEMLVEDREFRKGDIIRPPGEDTERIYLVGFLTHGRQAFGLKLTKDGRLDGRSRISNQGWNITVSYPQLAKSEILMRNVSMDDLENRRVLEHMKSPGDVETRKVTPEEAKKYGVKTILDDVEWFVDVDLPTTPTIGVNAAGLSFNQAAMDLMGIANGVIIRVGFAKGHLVIKKSAPGIPLRKANDKKTVVLQNKQLVGWLEKKNIKRQRYQVTYDQVSDAWLCKLEILDGVG